MSAGGGDLITTDEATVVAKPLFNVLVMEDSQSNRRLANSTSANQGDRNEIFCEVNDPLNQLVASKACSWWRWR